MMDNSTIERTVIRSDRFRTPNVHERTCGFWVDRVGWSREEGVGAGQALRILGLFAVVWVEEGRGVLETLEGPPLALRSGDVIWIQPEAAIGYRAVACGWTTHWMVWGGPEAQRLSAWCGLAEWEPRIRGVSEAVCRAYDRIRERVTDESLEAVVEREATVRMMIAEMLRVVRASRAPSRNDALSGVVDWIEGALEEPVTTARMARQAGWSETHFRRLFVERYGMTPQAYVLARRLARAKQGLAEGRRVRDVARSCGFADEYYFMRVFRREVGRTPGTWRTVAR